MIRPHRAVLGEAATWPLMWMFATLIAAPIIAASVKGSFVVAGSWPLYASTAGAILGVLGSRIPARSRSPHIREAVITVGALITSSILLSYGTPVYEPGMFFSGIILCCLLIISGRGALGIAAAGALLGLRAVAALANGPEVDLFAVIDLYSVVVLAIATAWLSQARRLIRKEADFRKRGRAAIELQRTRERELARMRMGNALAASGAQRALELLVASPNIDADVVHELRIAEASLRDHIRCRGLEHPILTPEIVAARRRGTDVLLIGTAAVEDGTIALDDQLASALTAALRETSAHDSVTIRQMPTGTSRAAVSFLKTDVDGGFELREFTSGGESIAPQ